MDPARVACKMMLELRCEAGTVARSAKIGQSNEKRQGHLHDKGNGDDPCNNGSPIDAMRIPISASRLVQVLDIYITTSNHKVIRDEDAKERTEEDAVAAQKGQKPRGIGEDVPWANGHAEQISEPHSSTDVEESREQGHDIGAEGNDVRAHITDHVGEDE